jgi:hypothetical protein
VVFQSITAWSSRLLRGRAATTNAQHYYDILLVLHQIPADKPAGWYKVNLASITDILGLESANSNCGVTKKAWILAGVQPFCRFGQAGIERWWPIIKVAGIRKQ